jgi:hypothetical protein
MFRDDGAGRRTAARAVSGVMLASAVALAAGLLLLDFDGGREQPGAQQASEIRRAWAQLADRERPDSASDGILQWPFSAAARVPRGMPVALRERAQRTLMQPGPLHLQFGQARRTIGPGGLVLWLVPGRGVICMFRASRLAAACRAKSEALSDGLSLQTYKVDPAGKEPERFTAFGVVPDGIHNIEVKVGHRRMQTAVSRNVYRVEAATPIRVVLPQG